MSIHFSNTSSGSFDLNAAIDQIAHWLPTQGPIKDFIHHNTLHAFEAHPFHQAVSMAAQIFGANSYLPWAEYHRRYREGRITEQALEWAIRQTGCDAESERELRAGLFRPDLYSHFPQQSIANDGLRNAWITELAFDLNGSVHPVIFRLLGNFLDQGISRWSLAKPGESFWQCVLRLVQNSLLPLYPLGHKSVRDLLAAGPEQVVISCLQRIVGDQSLYQQYLLELLLAHPGWSGMVRIIEQQPKALLSPREISLLDLLAVELACELAFVEIKRGGQFKRVDQLPTLPNVPRLDKAASDAKIPLNLRVWHEAMEWTLHAELLAALPLSTATAAKNSDIKVQALFCIDDRECSLRRHLEELDATVETFGAPGFFGIDFLYQGLDDAYPVAQCPVVIKPKHLILEAGQPLENRQNGTIDKLRDMHFGAHSMFRGWLYTQTLGLAYAFRLGWSVLRPGSEPPGIARLSEVEAHSHLHLLRESDEPNEDGYLLGFSLSEMADRVGGLLCNIGLTKGFAPLIVVVAHGSSSVNNPHFAAYDCGACSGKPGAPNARAFAWMANHPAVRGILRQRGIDIPDSSQFTAAMHNTSRDEIEYFDQQTLDKSTRQALKAFQHTMQHALQRNARERCRWFELGPKAHNNDEAHRHVLARASSIFEPRPELNHSNNLYCIVGRRQLTKQLFLDRRAFLQSYDPTSDVDGSILLKILSAVIPVCGGINLEYLFSRIDNSVYGAGTKLPHNVIGLLGVANGVEGDLRTGLPVQMIEVHEPARLLMLVEQTTAIADLAIDQLGQLRQWLDNEWIRFAVFDPHQRQSYWYSKSGWKSVELDAAHITPTTQRSEKVIVGQTHTLPVHLLDRSHA